MTTQWLVSPPDRLRRLTPALAAVAVFVLAMLLPLGLDSSNRTVYVLLALAVLNTLGLSLIMGYGGQVSLGQAAFYAVGAYTAALLATNGIPTLLGLVAAPVAAALVAVVVGIPLLRLSGHFLAFASLGFHLILLAVIAQAKDLTGGDIGLQNIPQLSIGPVEFDSDLSYAWLAVVVATVLLLVSRNIIYSRAGRGLRALASSEAAAAAAGVPVGRYKLTVFAISAGFGGLAGGIYAYFIGYLAPGSFPVLLAFEFVVMAAIGGMGTIAGPVVGATLVTVVVQILNDLGTRPGMPAYAPSVMSNAVYAVLLIVFMIFLRRGIVPVVHDVSRGWRARWGDLHSPSDAR